MEHMTRHLSTLKHKICENTKFDEENTNEKVEKVAKIEEDKLFVCECGKQYRHQSSLWNHKKKCTYEEEEEEECEEIKNSNSNGISEELVVKLNEIVVNSVQTVIKELAPQIGTQIGTQNNTNTINNNQRFNINVFLNEKCKDAMNMSDFIKSIEVSLQQLDLTKTKGLEQGITNVIMENMSNLSVYERPIHCTDMKRETIYIKDDDKWEKDGDKTKIKYAIKKTSGKNYDALVKWTKENPDFMDSDDKQRYYALALSKLGKPLNGIDDKVIKKICNQTYIKDDLNDEL
tara:strand:- start:7163 stop:8029 length:867 start_codon:yes stop_codon:yes gene_type:complete